LSVLSTDKGSKTDIPKWIGTAGHNLIGVFTRDGFDEIIVEKVR
jgi:TusA-related sulfurtransferase